MEKFYTYANGKYWGSVVDSDQKPFPEAVEVTHPPDTHADQVWNGSEWSVYTPPVPLLTQLDNLFLTLDQTDQVQFLGALGGIYALINQNQMTQAKNILAAIPTTGAAATVQAEMLAVLNGV